MSAAINEAKVRDSLLSHLEKLEPGLEFLNKESKVPSQIGTTGFIDILAQDVDSRYVLIEVKKAGPATREALHEILKYIEGVKAHLGLRENELRVIVASVEWRELLVPFSSFVKRTTCRVDGYRLQIDGNGNVISAQLVSPLSIETERVLAPWHELRFYRDEARLSKGVRSYEEASAAKAIESFVLIILDAPKDHSDGFPSTKQISNRGLITQLAANADMPESKIEDARYKSAIYFAMQQLSKDEYIKRLSVDAERKAGAIESIAGMSDEETLLTLHEAVLDLQPHPESDFFEIGYPAKFRGRLLDDEGWQIREIRRYGSFARNALLSDDTIVDEISGAQGNTGQKMKMKFHPAQKAEMAEVRRRVEECLGNNGPWRGQINFVLKELERSNEERQCYIQVYNPSSAITSMYLAATRENGILYVPTYQIRVPETDGQCAYFGVLKHNGSRPRTLQQIVSEFYDGQVERLLFTLNWGGYEPRDVEIVRRLGLRYRTIRVRIDDEKRHFFELDDHEWEDSVPIDPFGLYFDFLNEHESLTKEICKLYEKHWDGHVIRFGPED